MLSEDRWRALSPLLDRALEMDEEERAPWLASLGANDPALAADVADLLAAGAAARRERFLDDAPPRPPLFVPAAGQALGAWTLESLIGQGGMGNVWRARRSDGRFEGIAAVKLLNAALLGRAGEQRFRREGSILARLTHPNIAHLVDAGVSEGGQPYLVLEYVEGAPIDRWCDERGLGVPARLRLFLSVLAAVAHAHASLVVHRDIKPSNVMVARDGRVKLLDFGIAKLLEGEPEGQATILTRDGGRALTPEFAAPEQLTGGAVTTATDVYALGSLLYILLAGRHPVEDALRTPATLVRAIVDTEPERLSTVVDDAGARRRGTTVDALRRALAGDLETIVGKAMKKDPAERYASATAFAEDIERFLEYRPIAARPDTVAYRAARFVRRNRVPVALGTLVLVALVAGLAGTLTQARRAVRQRDFALRQLSRAEALNDLNAFLLSDAAPSGRPFTVRELLGRAEAIVERERGESDENRAEMLLSIGMQYWGADEDAKARRVLEHAHALARKLGDRALLAKTSCALAGSLQRSGEGTRAEALLLDGLRALPREPQFALDRVFCLLRASSVAREEGKVQEAVGYAEEAHRVLGASGVSAPLRELVVAMDVAEAYRMAGRQRDADAAFERAFERLRSLGRDETERAGTLLNNWGLTLQALGDPLKAESAFRRAVAISSADGSEEGVSPMLLTNLARSLVELRRLDEASARADRAYEGARRGGDQIVVNQSLLVRAAAYRLRGELDRADEALQEVGPRLARMLPPGHIAFAALANETSLLQEARGDLAAAARSSDEAVRIAEASTQSTDALHRYVLRRAALRLRLGRAEDARADAERALDLERRSGARGGVSCRVGRASVALGRALAELGRRDEARAAFAEAVRSLEPTLGAAHPETEEARRLANG